MNATTSFPDFSLVVMGVSGCGKSTLAAALANRLGWRMVEGDDFHAPANRDKMARGLPLTDADRVEWLAALGRELAQASAPVVLACSALKRKYRDQLRVASPGLRFVFLQLSLEAARERVGSRPDHFFSAALVQSQFQTLEPPVGETGVLTVDANAPLAQSIDEVQQWMTKGAP
jgi:gluconokinase